MFSHLDQAQADAGKILARQPVQQLKQLQLIVEIVLEPQDGLVMIAEARERAVPLGKSQAEVAVAPQLKSDSPRARISESASSDAVSGTGPSWSGSRQAR